MNVQHALAAADENPFEFVPGRRREPGAGFVGLFVGPHIRAVLAALLVVACGLWVNQNALVSAADVQTQATAAANSGDLTQLQQTATRDLGKLAKPLAIAGLPPTATEWVDGWNVGFAGILLFASLFSRGNVMSIFALLGAAVAAVGHQHGIRTVEPFLAEHIALMLASVLALIGFRAAR